MCGSTQYYKVMVPAGQKCDITWTVAPNSGSDYDLYVKWTAGASPSKASYDDVSKNSNTTVDALSKTQLSNGTYYAMVYNYGGSGSYTMSSQTICKQVSSPTATFSAGATSIASGQSVTLTWSSNDTTSCTATAAPSNSQWSGTKATSGSQTISSLTATTAFALSCSNTNSSINKSASVNVSTSASKSIAVVSPNGGETWVMGNSYDIVWNSSNVDKVNISIEFSGTGGLGIITSGISASLGKYSWKPDTSSANNGQNKIIIYDSSDSSLSDKSDNYFTINPSGSSTTSTTSCDSSSYSSSSSVYDFGSTGSTKSNMCGDDQYFKFTISSGQTCDLLWTLQPDSNSDYDLYTKWNDSAVTRNVYSDRATNSKGQQDILTKKQATVGTYYIVVHKESSTTGSYSISPSLSNCSNAASPTVSTTNTPANSITDTQIITLQNQVSQLLAQITQLQTQLSQLSGKTSSTSQQTATGITANSSTPWCYTFQTKLKYGSSGYAVGALQAALQKEGFLQGNLDAYFGGRTFSAVVAFQEKYKSEILTPFSLSEGTGYVGNSTINKLNQLYGCK